MRVTLPTTGRLSFGAVGRGRGRCGPVPRHRLHVPSLARVGGVRPLEELPGFLLPAVGGQCQDRDLAAVEEAVPNAFVLLCAYVGSHRA
jgi:hypothetical protein